LSTNIHPTAEVSPDAQVGEGTRIWHQAQVREGARIGRDCILGKGVYIDRDVVVGDRCKLQNLASVYHGVKLADGVFIGPHAVFTNDRYPRAVNPDGSLKGEEDWESGETHVGEGASIGAGAVIRPASTSARSVVAAVSSHGGRATSPCAATRPASPDGRASAGARSSCPRRARGGASTASATSASSE
jgi:UDP-3-O-[3-hydroxymyristoyl] glucosamine N-acyltransferase